MLINSSRLALALLNLLLLLVLLSHLDDLLVVLVVFLVLVVFVVFVVFVVGDSGFVNTVLASFLGLPICRLDLVESLSGLVFAFVDGGGDLYPGLAFAFEEKEFCVFFGCEDGPR